MNFFRELLIEEHDKASYKKLKFYLTQFKLIKVSLKNDSSYENFYNELFTELSSLKQNADWIEVKYSEGRGNYNTARDFHTDEAYLANHQEICLMYCVQKAESGGGEMIYADAESIYRYIERENPEIIQKLQNTFSLFKKENQERRSRILWKDDNGKIKINWNYKRCEVSVKEDLELVSSFHIQLGKFIDKNPYQDIQRCDLSRGEAVIWWDSQVVHGRAPIINTTDPTNRYYRKTSFDL